MCDTRRGVPRDDFGLRRKRGLVWSLIRTLGCAGIQSSKWTGNGNRVSSLACKRVLQNFEVIRAAEQTGFLSIFID